MRKYSDYCGWMPEFAVLSVDNRYEKIKCTDSYHEAEPNWSNTLFFAEDPDRILADYGEKSLIVPILTEKGRSYPTDRYPYAVDRKEAVEPWLAERIWRRLLDLPWDIAEDEHLKIRELVCEDLPIVYEILEGSAFRQQVFFASGDRRQDEKSLAAYRKEVYGLLECGLWLVTDRRNGEAVAIAGLFFDDAGRIPQVGYVVHPAHRGKGIASATVGLILEYAGEDLGYCQVEAYTKKDNRISMRVLEKNGFRRENENEEGKVRFLRTVGI